MASYARNLLLIRCDAGADEWDGLQALAEATSRQRCEAAMRTLRETGGQHGPIP
jgi:hypothetical protein